MAADNLQRTIERLVSQPNDTVGVAGRSSITRITAKAQICAGNREIALWPASSSAIDDADFLKLAGVPRNPIGDTCSLGGIAAGRRPGGRIVLDFVHEQCIRFKANCNWRLVLPVEWRAPPEMSRQSCAGSNGRSNSAHKMGGTEFCKQFEPISLKKINSMSVPFNELPAPKLLDCPIHVYRRKAARIGDVLLCKWNMEATIVQKPDELKPRGDLAKKMSKSGQRFPGAKIFDPFAIESRCESTSPANAHR
ncbi:hypothetical protein ACVIGB_008797 [Bradyrhizobium sp. USDA 4341]